MALTVGQEGALTREDRRVANGSPRSLKPEMNEMAAKRKGFPSLIDLEADESSLYR